MSDLFALTGKSTPHCYFDREEQTYFQRTFFVLPKISSQVALTFGGRFLAQTKKTLTKHQRRLEDVAKAVPQVMNMGVSKGRLACYIDSVLTLAVADTGSEVNLRDRRTMPLRRSLQAAHSLSFFTDKSLLRTITSKHLGINQTSIADNHKLPKAC